MSKHRVFVLDPYHSTAIDLLIKDDTIDLVTNQDPRVKNWKGEAEGLMIRSETRLSAQDLNDAKKLRVIVKQGVGIDNVDLEAAKQLGITVCNTPGMNSEAVAELTLSLALSVARRVNELDRRIRSGEKIVRSLALGQSLYKKTIGIVGMGNIGRVVARKWIGAMEGAVIAYDPLAPKDVWSDIAHRRVGTLEELISEADVVTLHVPLTADTKNMIGKEQFSRMKPSTIFINAARGGVVNEAALLEALTSKKIYGAALDASE